MEAVGLQLQRIASDLSDHVERDLFARSAFNRYYCATYLDVKNGLGSLNAGWRGILHSQVSTILEGPVNKELAKGRDRAKRASDANTSALCSRAMHATRVLSDLMNSGYATGVAADYFSAVRIDFADAYDFTLNSVRVKEAGGCQRRRRQLGTVLIIVSQLQYVRYISQNTGAI